MRGYKDLWKDIDIMKDTDIRKDTDINGYMI